MELHDYLNTIHPISPGEFEFLAQGIRPLYYKKGSNIIAEGEVQKDLFFVRSGIQMSFYESEKRTHVLAFTYHPGLCAIPDSFCLQTPSKYHLTAITDSELDAIPYSHLMAAFDQFQNIERLFRKMTEYILCGVIERHMELHSLSIEERYLNFCRRSPQLLQSIPHKHLASYLDIDSTNFSKLFNSVKI